MVRSTGRLNTYVYRICLRECLVEFGEIYKEVRGEAVPVLLRLEVFAVEVIADYVQVELSHAWNGMKPTAKSHTRIRRRDSTERVGVEVSEI